MSKGKAAEYAKKLLLEDKTLTCVFCKGKSVIKSDKAGLKPILGLIEQGLDLNGFCVADKIIGKAAAMLFIANGITEVFGSVMSKSAIAVFEKYGIEHSYEKLAEKIINNAGTGPCPMELSVESLQNPELAYFTIKERLEKMRNDMKQEGACAKKLGFGLMRMPVTDNNDATSFDYKTINKMVDEFLAQGFTYFDTAYVYHDGKAENMFKQCIAQRYPREKFTIATKLPLFIIKTVKDQKRIFNEQLANCGVDYFDYYLLHSINSSKYKTVCECKSFEFGFEQKNKGLIKNFGFSFHDSPELLDEILTAHPNVDFVQLQINYLDWNNPSIQSRKCYEIARKHNVKIIVMEPIKGGQLASVPSEVEQLMKKVNPNMSVSSWAIRFAASLDGVMMVLSGMSTLQQLEDNIFYMKNFTPLSEQEQEIITKARSIIEKDIAIGCTACSYCVKGCPKNIAIPNYFALFNESKRAQNAFIPHVYYNNISVNRGKASECIRCGQCENICPQKLKIIDALGEVASTFENK